MMLDIDWATFAIGMLTGLAAGALYFAGLAWGVQIALRRTRTAAVLLPSAAIRIALLLVAGWWTASLGAAALAGFAVAFVALRFLVVATVRPKDAGGVKS